MTYNPIETETTANTFVSTEDNPHPVNGAHHRYSVRSDEHNVIAVINFQNGPVKESGVNGLQNEDLIAMCIHRLKCFQSGQSACQANADALTALEDALEYLHSGTRDRVECGVE
jgi:hypothetical protein